MEDKSKWWRNGYGVVLTSPKNGKYSPEETKILKEAMADYCRTNKITPERLCDESDKRSDHLRGAWLQIAQTLPHRTLQSVYRHGIRIFHPFKRGQWSEAETNELLVLVTNHGKRWAYIQKKLNRSADSCRDKYREIWNDNLQKGKWTEEENRLLLKHVREALKVNDDVPLKELQSLITQSKASRGSVALNWEAISSKMKNRSRLSCFGHFRNLCATSNSTISSESNSAKDVSTVAKSSNPSSSNGNELVSKGKNDAPMRKAQDGGNKTSYEWELLNTIASSNYNRETDVPWNTLRYPPGDAKEKWCTLSDEWALMHGCDLDLVMEEKTVSELARIMLKSNANEPNHASGKSDNDSDGDDSSGSDDDSNGDINSDSDGLDQAEMAARTVKAVLDI
jgi:hypothetical protein